jgi:hypothetical protein
MEVLGGRTLVSESASLALPLLLARLTGTEDFLPLPFETVESFLPLFDTTELALLMFESLILDRESLLRTLPVSESLPGRKSLLRLSESLVMKLGFLKPLGLFVEDIEVPLFSELTSLLFRQD